MEVLFAFVMVIWLVVMVIAISRLTKKPDDDLEEFRIQNKRETDELRDWFRG